MRKRDDDDDNYDTKNSRSRTVWDEKIITGFKGQTKPCVESNLTYAGIQGYIAPDCHLYQNKEDYEACNSASGEIDSCDAYHKDNPMEYIGTEYTSCKKCRQPHKPFINCPSCTMPNCPLRSLQDNRFCARHTGTRCKEKYCTNTQVRQDGRCIHHVVQYKLLSYYEHYPEKWKIDNDMGFLYVNLNAISIDSTLKLLNTRLYELNVLFEVTEIEKVGRYSKYALILKKNNGEFVPDEVKQEKAVE